MTRVILSHPSSSGAKIRDDPDEVSSNGDTDSDRVETEDGLALDEEDLLELCERELEKGEVGDLESDGALESESDLGVFQLYLITRWSLSLLI